MRPPVSVISAHEAVTHIVSVKLQEDESMNVPLEFSMTVPVSILVPELDSSSVPVMTISGWVQLSSTWSILSITSSFCVPI